MKESKYLSGGKLAGGNPERGRVENDFYATDPSSVKVFLDTYKLEGTKFLEPCVGQGHIAEVVKEYYPNSEIVGFDIVDRGYDVSNTEIRDFLLTDAEEVVSKYGLFDTVITNPPYALAQEFVEKSLSLVRDKGTVTMFLKLQFLEGVKRQQFFKANPPKFVYVFVSRQSPWMNGSPVDEKGKKWSSTMCFAWFVWEKGFQGEPIVRWL